MKQNEESANSELSKVDNIAKEFAELSNDERLDIINDYCTYCGHNEKEYGKCYCAPCYDE